MCYGGGYVVNTMRNSERQTTLLFAFVRWSNLARYR